MTDDPLLVALLEHSAAGAAILDGDGRVVFINPAAASILNTAVDDILGMSGFGGVNVLPVSLEGEQMSHDETPAYRAVVGREAIDGELMGLAVPDRDGITWVQVHAVPYDTGGGLFTFLSFVDVTLAVEMELVKNDLLVRDEDLADRKMQFIQNTSHELRTPLMLIIGYLEQLQLGDLALDDQSQSYFDIALRRAYHLRDILNQMLALYEAASGQYFRTIRDKFTHVFLSDIVATAVSDFRPFAQQAGVHLELEPVCDPGCVDGHHTLIAQAVDNVLMNAVKFTSPKEDGRVSVSLRVTGEFVIIVVRDTGIGIPHDKIDRVFDLFYQIDGSATRHYPGNGLGLAVVKEVMTLHFGRVRVESNLGDGSSFSLEFPKCRRL